MSASSVAEHYNRLNPTDLATRSESKIFYLRNFNNWIKSVLINETIKRIKNEKNTSKISVLDLGSGKGGDILKWKKANVSRVTFADIAEKSIEECKNRYENPVRAHFNAEFIHLDATSELIRDKIANVDNLEHDMVSSQFVIHYSFESFEKADTFIQNVSDSLKPGGYFIGTTTNSYELMKRLRSSKENSFGNDLYNIKFYNESKEDFPLFGHKFDFQLQNVVECPEYVINFDALELIAKKHNLKLVLCKTFSEYFEENSNSFEYTNLISIMQALEPYYSKNLDKSLTEPADSSEYDYIKSYLSDDKVKTDLNYDEQYVTMSSSEWEVATLYLVFGFVKLENITESDTETKSETNDSKQESSDVESESNVDQKSDDETKSEANDSSLKRKLSDTSESSDSETTTSNKHQKQSD